VQRAQMELVALWHSAGNPVLDALETSS
jgi:hypothetical protein